MTSRAEPKVLTAGQICVGERAWSAAKCMVAALPRTLWYLSCLSWNASSSRQQRRAVLSAWPGTRTTNGVEPNRHISTRNPDRFARRQWDLGARAALPWSPGE
jgi:hypothetical protein